MTPQRPSSPNAATRSVEVVTPLTQGGTGKTTAAEARAALDVPSLSGANTFSGACTFSANQTVVQQLQANVQVSTDGEVVIGAGTIDANLLTGSQAYQLPDKSGTFAMTSDITGGGPVATYSATAADGVGVASPEVILASAPAGFYRMSVWIKVNGENGDTSFGLIAAFGGVNHYGMPVDASTATASASVVNSLPTIGYCVIVGYHSSGDITFSTDGYTSTDSIDVYIALEQLI